MLSSSRPRRGQLAKRDTQLDETAVRPGGTTWRHPFIIYFLFLPDLFFLAKQIIDFFFSLVAVYRRIFVFISISSHELAFLNQFIFLFFFIYWFRSSYTL
jgi:hypothetical protein